MTANGGRLALRLFEIVGRLARDTDLTSTNQRNDLVVLLSDADTAGAQSFAGRLQERVIEEMKEDPALWMRSFPDLEESTKRQCRASRLCTAEPSIGGQEIREGWVRIQEDQLSTMQESRT